jgi:hypothetical protein
MDKEPLEAKEIQYWTFEQLLEHSLDELRKSLGLPKVIEADEPEHFTDTSKAIKDKKEGN